MSQVSPLLALPFIQPAQAQKHVTHNEALQILDLAVQLAVDSRSQTAPPDSPAPGARHIVPPGASGAWAGQDGRVALFEAGDWRLADPRPGWSAQVLDEGVAVVFDGAAWTLPGLGAASAERLGINAAADAVNRLTVAAPATLLTHDGAGHQLKLNKAAAGDTASLLFQTGWSGRAEMGTTGGDDFAIRVSADGGVWADALLADRATGRVSLPGGLEVGGSLTLPAASIPRAALTPGAARSLLGRSAGSAGAVADIAAGSDHQVMRRSGSSIGFGAVALNQSAAVTGTLGLAHGGTGAATAEGARAGLGLGSAATAALTAGPADATPGRVLQTGDGGLLGNAVTLGATDDLNGLTVNGFYGWNNSNVPANAPGGVFGNLIHFQRADTSRSQLVIGGSERRVWLRQWGGGDWSDWFELFHSGTLLGTVTQTAGIPTGAVFQTGATATGRFQRDAAGEQVCRHRLTTSAAGPTVWTYPAPFAAEPVIVATALAAQAVVVTIEGDPGTGSASVSAWSLATGNRVAVPVQLRAEGRWTLMT